MKKSDKIIIIALLIIAIFLGLLVVNVAAQTLSQYQERCQEWYASRNVDDNTPCYPQRCYDRSYRSCGGWWPFRGGC